MRLCGGPSTVELVAHLQKRQGWTQPHFGRRLVTQPTMVGVVVVAAMGKVDETKCCVTNFRVYKLF
jgi:hypothetical protein